ncbi:ThiF family adenylyltransferase [Pseudoalteromonas spongiae]|uniref:ThiF family adenylyltransferase n=1 Tax=Pseudoalteromonas spongiae TaxID=298657 RepID=UPI0037357421
MSLKQTVRNPSVLRLIEDGFEVEIVNQHLLIHSIPHLNSELQVVKATLACPLVEMGDEDTKPQDHTMWLQGDMPFMGNGQPMSEVVNHSNARELYSGFKVNHYLSNKPNNQPFPNFYEKVVHYHTVFVSQARLQDPNADGRTHVVHRQRDDKSVFQYPDTASSRVGITAISQKLANKKIAIIGVGGTGSYILDQLAKTPVEEIHLFDGDILEPHNAYRTPGAVPFEVLVTKPKKVDYFFSVYSKMHKGIKANPTNVTSENLEELAHLDFVFLSIDSGSSRKLIASYLIKAGIPFIDVGMGIDTVNKEHDEVSLHGSCRVTLITPEKSNLISRHLILEDDNEDDAVYQSNIQISDMNAINAMLAITKWKQYMNFYNDDTENTHHFVYTPSFQSIARSDES